MDDPDEDVDFFVKAWKKAKTPEQQEKVLTGLMINAGRYDRVTRSLVYYPKFERKVGRNFERFWR